jgi:uncharacterized protein (DUF1697 family)
MGQVVALLRGINLGSHNRIGMADLRDMLGEMGYEGVRTHLQSGNVILAADDPPDHVARAMERQIRERFGIDVDVVARTAEELAAVVAANPLGDVATDGAKHMVVFLAAEPGPATLRALEAGDLGPERFAVQGRELYAWCPDGVRTSKVLTIAVAKGGPAATARNWNTVTKLLAMLSDDR